MPTVTFFLIKLAFVLKKMKTDTKHFGHKTRKNCMGAKMMKELTSFSFSSIRTIIDDPWSTIIVQKSTVVSGSGSCVTINPLSFVYDYKIRCLLDSIPAPQRKSIYKSDTRQ